MKQRLCALLALLLFCAAAAAQAAPKEEKTMLLKINNTILTVTMAQNSTVDALLALLDEGEITLDMADYAGMEKGAELPVSLPQNNTPMNTQAGDVILFQGRTFVVYYAPNAWSLTPLGKVQNTTPEQLRALLGDGDVTVTLMRGE